MNRDVASTIEPGGRTDVKIVRDKQTGTPHIIGTTRAGTEFGAGYAAGQDRLWLMDVFRHIGRGELSSFAGGAPNNRKLEQQFYLQGAYTEKELAAQVQRVRHEGPRGAQGYRDILNYVAEHRRSLPVILLSGMKPEEIQDKMLNLRDKELPPLLLKPVDPEQLVEVVELQLSGELPLD